ncbi:hypothetical protein [Clostridium sp.]|uniref:hypothetical protein n=1 Tax=Clostridium sp. TaxID=1506 RepID=UPI0026181D27|nr:hypothetical protein [uncultured Clostridium sp.]
MKWKEFTNEISDKIDLHTLKKRLKKYQSAANCYAKENNYMDFFHQQGIPHTVRAIRLLEAKINKRDI